MDVTIYHNPRCSKSRRTLALLRDRGIEPRIVEYLDRPPTADELTEILRLLGLGPRQVMRRKEAPYAVLGLDDEDLDDAYLLQAMVDNPILIERPVVVADGKAAVGRPPEKVLAIL